MSQPTRFTPEMIEAYVRQGFWRHETTLDILDRHAEARPDDVALVDPHRRLTWAAARAAVANMARQLDRLGLKRDTPVVVQLHNTAESCLVRLALKRVGLLGAYVPVVWRRGELEAVIEVLRPGAVLVPERFRDTDMLELARALRRGAPDLQILVLGPAIDADDCVHIALEDAAIGPEPSAAKRFGPFEVTKLVVTSGSTGTPKLVERPEQQELLWGRGAAERMRLDHRDTIGCFAPLSGGPGYHAWAAWIVSGAALVLSDGFGPQTMLSLIERERITAVMTAPAVVARLVDSPKIEAHDIGSLRIVRTGAAGIPSAVVKRAEERLGCILVKAGGAMEACPFGQMSVEDPPQIRHSEAVGKVVPGGEVRVVDAAGEPLPPGSPGELLVRGAATSSGYYRDPERTVEAWGALGPDGWFRTGDIATIDAHGYVTLIGRMKEMINRGGANIFPLELEDILANHPKILETAVIGIPDPTLGEVPCLCVIPSQGAEVTLEEIVDFLRDREIARYKFPARLVVVADFPRGPTMRVNRRRLAEQVSAGLAPPGPGDGS